MFVGWGWATTTHDVTVIDDAGNVVDRWAPEHTETGLDQTLARLVRRRQSEELAVAIERPAGWSSTGCWRRATRSSRSTATRSTPAPLDR